jgi:hypothetical protein
MVREGGNEGKREGVDMQQKARAWSCRTVQPFLYSVHIGATARCCAGFGQGTGQIVLDQVNCVGTEASLFECPANPLNSHDCSHFEDVGIICQCMSIGTYAVGMAICSMFMVPVYEITVHCSCTCMMFPMLPAILRRLLGSSLVSPILHGSWHYT